MLFNSLEFLVFLPATLVAYFLARGEGRIWVLLAAGLFFYGWWRVDYLLVLGLITLSTFWCAQAIRRSENDSQARTWLVIALVLNLGILGWFKYFNFFAQTAVDALRLAGVEAHTPAHSLLLPIGISFHTFQCIGYVIDVWRSRTAYEHSLLHYSVYSCFFPQLVAGPIERAAHLLPQLRTPQPVTYEDLLTGLLQILWGLFLKLVIADNAATYVDAVFADPRAYSGGHFILATFCYSYQIFCDFAGYSLIALGCARLMGIDLMVNFRRPYFAQSVREFWSRWHISLSTWFRDYLYVPLGGNRHGEWRTCRNLLLVFLASGLWHGANWTFVVWGALHGLAVVVETLMRGWAQALVLPAILAGVLRAARHVALVSFIAITWIFFRAENIDSAIYILSHLTSGFEPNLAYVARVVLPFTGDGRSVGVLMCLLAFIVLLESVHLVQERQSQRLLMLFGRPAMRWACAMLLGIVILLFGRFDAKSFIYFQF